MCDRAGMWHLIDQSAPKCSVRTAGNCSHGPGEEELGGPVNRSRAWRSKIPNRTRFGCFHFLDFLIQCWRDPKGKHGTEPGAWTLVAVFVFNMCPTAEIEILRTITEILVSP